ncbi:MAG TPA: CocE/NonD family hydrolase [Mycobacteriales bacterium]|nr:CocE/NonD family hydrolase [Mycobacteriales bacterium]
MSNPLLALNNRARLVIPTTVAVLAGLLGAVGVAASPAAATHATDASSAAANAPLTVRGSVHQVDVTGLPRNARVGLVDRAGHRVASKRADSLGGLVFYHVKPGRGYRVRRLPHGRLSRPVTVHTGRSRPWDPKVYRQTIPDAGYSYLTTRDGTKLAIDVHPPTSPAGLGLPPITLPGGLPDYAPPYPTLIEYSGYGYADPSGPQSGIAILANLMGFAVVDVNMRGTGCSAGAFNFFERLQDLDGYDVIEAIAHQPWVLDHKVGMMGISYGAISQLFTAQTRPPALEAISPLSTIDATATTLYPGGILNTGFAVAWAKERQQNAEPAGPGTGQSWAYRKIQNGDQTCARNQALHGEAEDLLAKIRANRHYHPKVADPLDPITFVHKIQVPVFMACQWQDEQTGGHCPDLAAHFTGTRHKWFTFTNGAHIDSLDPATFNRWYDFLELYVAHQAPFFNAAVIHAASPVVYQQAMGVPGSDLLLLPSDRIQSIPTYAGALAAFQKLPQVRVLFDNGAGKSPLGGFEAGNPYPAFERSFARFPIPTTTAKRWYLTADGKLSGHLARHREVDTYTADAHARPMTDFGPNTGTGGLWGKASQWQWDWRQDPSGTAVSYISAPLKHATTVIGAGAVHLWVRSSTRNVDLQATVSEVDPDHHETFVQNGWLRANARRLATGRHTLLAQRSTLLAPVLSLKAADAQPMPKHKFVKLVIPLYYQGHAYRAGSRIRVTISAPNGSQPIWSFKHTVPARTAKVSVAFSRKLPSSLVLPVIPHVAVPAGFPPCPSLRNEPCRRYRPTVNQHGG